MIMLFFFVFLRTSQTCQRFLSAIDEVQYEVAGDNATQSPNGFVELLHLGYERMRHANTTLLSDVTGRRQEPNTCRAKAPVGCSAYTLPTMMSSIKKMRTSVLPHSLFMHQLSS